MLANSTLWYQHHAKSLAQKHPATERKDIIYQKSVFCCGWVPWDSRFITN